MLWTLLTTLASHLTRRDAAITAAVPLHKLTLPTVFYFPNEEGQHRLDAILEHIKVDGKGNPYDCIMGISGGLDSSYLTYLGHTRGLRILAFHVDDG